MAWDGRRGRGRSIGNAKSAILRRPARGRIVDREQARQDVDFVSAHSSWRGGHRKARFPTTCFLEMNMRVMVMVKATRDSEAGVMPSTEMMAEMGRFNEELVKAGVLLAADGLHPSSKGVRVRFSGTSRSVVDGPFAETNELVAGFWLWQVSSMEEAIEWVRRCPNPMPTDSEIEIRRIFEAEDFGAALTPELREQEERQRRQIDDRNAHGA
jgi:hypothetical protein